MFPQLVVYDTSVDMTLAVNTALVPNGSIAEVYVPESALMPVKTETISGRKLTARIDELNPGFTYKYKITFKDGESNGIIDQSIFGEFRTNDRK